MNKPELIKTFEPDLEPAGCESIMRQRILDRQKEVFFASGGRIEIVEARKPLVELPPINEFNNQPDHSRSKTTKKHNDKQKADSGKQKPRANRKSTLPVNIRKCKNYYTIDIRDITQGQYPLTIEGLIEAIKDRNKTRAILMMCPIVESGWWDAYLDGQMMK